MNSSFRLDDARLTMAREYGFRNWDSVGEVEGMVVNAEFENSLDEFQSGDIQRLRFRLVQMPELAVQRSSFGHQSTLLHYLAANGAESHRQKVPMNAPELARLLIQHGADILAEANMYGGGQTPLALSESSAHPVKAGISHELNRALNCASIQGDGDTLT